MYLLSIIPSRSIHVLQIERVHSFFNGAVIFPCVIVYVHYVFFIHSSIDGHLGCIHILAVSNNVSMNIRVHISF